MENNVFKYPVKFNISEAACDLLKSKYKDLVITDQKTYQAVVEGIREVRTLRVSVEKRRKELKRDALEYGRRVDSTAKTITEKLIPVEAHLKSLKKAEDDRKLQERLEKERKEKERIDRIKTKLQDLSFPDPLSEDGQGFYLESSSQLHSRIEKLEGYEILSSDFEEFSEKAQALKVDTLAKLKALEQLKATQEAQARQEEKEQIAKEKALAEQARLAEKKRLEQEKALAEKRKAQEEEERLLQIEREKQEIILQNLRAEQEAKAKEMEEKRLEQEKLFEEKRKEQEEKERLLEAKRQELEHKAKIKNKTEKLQETEEIPSEIKKISLTQDEQKDIKSLDAFLINFKNLISDTQQSLKSESLQNLFYQFTIEFSDDAIDFLSLELAQWQKGKK